MVYISNKYFLSLLFVMFLCYLPLIRVNALENDIYKTITANNIIYVVENDGAFSHSWSFNKELFRDDIDFSLKFLKFSPNVDIIEKTIANNINRKYLFFEHHGSLPTNAEIKVKVSDRFKDGEKLYLYYFNEETNKLEYIDKNLTVKNGFVKLEIEHCSDYILTTSIVKSALDNPQSLTTIIIVLIIFGMVLIAVTLFLGTKR